jgi:hypothetical protein
VLHRSVKRQESEPRSRTLKLLVEVNAFAAAIFIADNLACLSTQDERHLLRTCFLLIGKQKETKFKPFSETKPNGRLALLILTAQERVWCSSCGDEILGVVISVAGLDHHEKCLLCNYCGCKIERGNLYEHNDRMAWYVHAFRFSFRSSFSFRSESCARKRPAIPLPQFVGKNVKSPGPKAQPKKTVRVFVFLFFLMRADTEAACRSKT